jgi:nitrogen fixation protein FixH
MAAILIGFFGIVIAVNFVMATNAVRTFGGVVVDNSYVASQRFNGWLADGRAQDALGWYVEAQGDGGALVVRLAGPAGPIDGATMQVSAEHPLGRLPGRSFALPAIGGGTYSAPHALTPGRWRIRIDAHANGRDAHFIKDVRL